MSDFGFRPVFLMLKRAARKPISRVVRRQLDQGHGEDGFTLMEIIIAILVLGIIMTAEALIRP